MFQRHWLHHPEKASVVANNPAHAEELAKDGFTPDPANSNTAAGRKPAAAAPVSGESVAPTSTEVANLREENAHVRDQFSRMKEKLQEFTEQANQRVIDLEGQVAKLQEELAHAGMEALNGLGEAVGEAADSR